MRKRTLGGLVGLLALAVILIGINLFVQGRLADVQVDATQGRVYTLSKGTKEVLAGLKEPITLRLFYSRQLGSVLPTYGALEDRVQQMLTEYARLSNGKLRFETYDPQPYSATEDRAVAYGLQGVPLDQGGEQIYFGLAGTNQVDTERTIGFFKPEREAFLEYDLTKLVYELSNPKRPVVGLMTSLPMEGDPRAAMMGQKQTPWMALQELQEDFTVKDVGTDVQAIPPEMQVLMVVQPPKTLSEATQYAIDQFVMRGGHLLVMVDPQSEMAAQQPGPDGQPKFDNSSDLPKLFAAWGITYDPKIVVGDLSGAWRVRSSDASDQVQAVEYVAWYTIRDGISHNDPATADLSQVTVASPGAIGKKPGSDITLTPLLTATGEVGSIPVDKVAVAPDPAKILADFKPDHQSRVIAARISGVLHSAFTGPPTLPAGQKPDPNLPPYKAQTAGPANMVVMADTDILADRFWVRVGDFFGDQTAVPFADNGAFIGNIVGTLAGGDVLLGLRGRGVVARPFTVVDEIRQQSDARYRQTEEGLTKHLQDLEKQVSDLRSTGSGASQAVLTPAQQTAIDQARTDILDTRQKLRAVQLELRQDISDLETKLRLFNIVLVPAVLTLLAIVIALVNRGRRSRARTS
jgi:ABC-type uncharacterized transport system involved in gliding motility auxiliary subunit